MTKYKLYTKKPEEASCSGCAHTQGVFEPPQGAQSPPGTSPAVNKYTNTQTHKYTDTQLRK